jgi:hypothetical protein
MYLTIAYLNNPKTNIDAAAKLMSIYFKDICAKSKKISPNFYALVAKDEKCNITNFCCLKTCQEKNSWYPPQCAVAAFAGLWNNGIDILMISKEKYKASPHLDAHSHNAYILYYFIHKQKLFFR